MGSVVFDQPTKRRLQAALEEHRTNPEYAPILAEAKERGFRLAEVWEREFLSRADLCSWRGTVWVKLEEEK